MVILRLFAKKGKEPKMLIQKKVVVTLMIITTVFFIWACGGSKLKLEPIAKSENPTELINQFEKDITNARRNSVNVLAPTGFAKAETSLKEAKEGLARGDKIAKILNYIAQGRAQLQEAEQKSQVSRTTLDAVIKGRDLARAAGATELGKDYAEVEEEFLELTKAVEKGNLSSARKYRAKVKEDFRKLELRAIKIRTLGEVRKLLVKAKREGANKIAPRSYAIAQTRLKEADAFITNNPYKKEEMRQRANLALFMAQRVFEVARQCEKIKGMESEQVTLMVEGVLYKIAGKLSAPDMRNQSFDTQVENIQGTIATLQNDRSFMIKNERDQQAQIAAFKIRIAELEGKSQVEREARERLLAEKRFNQLFNQVQSFFESQEAETYKMGNKLVVRLKGIQFPVGKSVILPQNYALLSKIQRTIRTLGEVDVVIEGHSDSTGSAQLNEHLSEQRADAVRQYLVANETLPYDKIIAVGYGSIRPIASNKTSKGRAMNRRIDLIITPHITTVN
jgi:outer membrane protein OmpA-like peptidoglycan-associated protein